MHEVPTIPIKTLDEVIADWHAGRPCVLVQLCCGKEECDVAIWTAAFDVIRILREHDMVGKTDNEAHRQKFNKVIVPALLASPVIMGEVKTMAAFESACFAAGMLLNHGYAPALETSEPEDLRILRKPLVN